MTALVASHVNIIKPSNKGWKQCSCCPYGYHIDLDFVRYCENVVNSQLLPRAVGLSRKPKKRASMDVLLGLPDNYQVRSKEKEPTSPTWDGLEQAVEDFELTLRRASKLGQGTVSSFESDQEMKGDWFRSLQTGVPWRKRTATRTTPRPGKDTNLYRSITDRPDWLRKDADISYSPERSNAWQEKTSKDDYGATDKLEERYVSLDAADGRNASGSEPKSKETLETIRQQVASSLPEIKRLEEQVKQVPILQGEITRLKNENAYLSNKLNLAETNKTEGAIKTAVKTEDASPKKRNIAIGTTIITRDVGVSHKLPLTATCGVMTDHYEPTPAIPTAVVEEDKPLASSSTQTDKYYEVSLSHRSSQTNLKMDTVYSSEDLERNIDKAIKLYEKTFHHLLHPKKPFLVNSGVQVDTKTAIRRDYGVQVRQETSSCGTSFKPDCRNSGNQTLTERILKRDVAVSDDTIANPCRQCSVKKTSVGTVTHFEKGQKLISLGTRSNTFDHIELTKKTSRSVAVGPDKSVCSSKSTDTRELNTKKDVAVNTTKNKLVDTAVDPILRPPTLSRRRGSFSKIPRPVTSPQRSRSFTRQDTYLVSPSPSRKSYGSESFDFESGSEEGEYSSLKIDNRARQLPSEPAFQPIRLPDVHRVRKDLSQEIKGALKVLNDGLVNINDGNPSFHLRNALTIVQQEWFKVSSTEHADPLEVEDYLDCFEEFSSDLLRFIVNMVDNTGNTAMHYAVSHGHFDAVSILLDSKVCDINKRNAAGYTCIMLVSLAEVKSITHRQVVRRLFQLADVNCRAKQHGQTALMLAVSHGRMDMVELLLDSGADINIQDDDGSTALMCAAEHGHIDIVKFMLTQPECDLTITDCDGNTALNIAMEAANRDIGVLLYAQQHFSRGGSPYTSFKSKKPSGSSAPSRTPTSPITHKKT